MRHRVRYISECVRDPDVPQPPVRRVPSAFASDPHQYITQLNGGTLPYTMEQGSSGAHLTCVRPIVYECGPWAGCSLGTACPQATSQRGIKVRLEVFKTKDRGWGVRTWDYIPQYSYVCPFAGNVQRVEKGGCSEYSFDLGKRADMSWDHKYLPEDKLGEGQEVRYCVNAANMGNVGRYINHSCNPNLFVQPVIVGHTDDFQPTICFFAYSGIKPWTELTYDYGLRYVEDMQGCCLCKAPCCKKPMLNRC
eukprot:jgi/Botrbrau1/10512/Bobra.0133s0112.1